LNVDEFEFGLLQTKKMEKGFQSGLHEVPFGKWTCNQISSKEKGLVIS
jgi:hypothetical protein